MAKPTTVDEAIEQIATGTVQSSSEGERSLTHLSITELIKAKQHLEAQNAAGTNGFGIRTHVMVPPGTG